MALARVDEVVEETKDKEAEEEEEVEEGTPMEGSLRVCLRELVDEVEGNNKERA